MKDRAMPFDTYPSIIRFHRMMSVQSLRSTSCVQNRFMMGLKRHLKSAEIRDGLGRSAKAVFGAMWSLGRIGRPPSKLERPEKGRNPGSFAECLTGHASVHEPYSVFFAAWWIPIQTRTEALATGICFALGINIVGPGCCR